MACSGLNTWQTVNTWSQCDTGECSGLNSWQLVNTWSQCQVVEPEILDGYVAGQRLLKASPASTNINTKQDQRIVGIIGNNTGLLNQSTNISISVSGQNRLNTVTARRARPMLNRRNRIIRVKRR